MKRAVVLLSGGLDSSTVLAYARSEGYQVDCLSFDYGQRHRSELHAAKKIAEHYQVEHHHVIQLPMQLFAGNALTDQTLEIPEFDEAREDIPNTYVPARNILFLSFALAYAESIDANAIFIGASSVDYSGYPDCRPEFFEAYAHMANLGTRAGVEGKQITIETPLLHLSKAQTLQLGMELGLDYSMTVSCYRANPAGEACGQCDSCGLRRKGFEEAGIADPTHYIGFVG